MRIRSGTHIGNLIFTGIINEFVQTHTILVVFLHFPEPCVHQTDYHQPRSKLKLSNLSLTISFSSVSAFSSSVWSILEGSLIAIPRQVIFEFAQLIGFGGVDTSRTFTCDSSLCKATVGRAVGYDHLQL